MFRRADLAKPYRIYSPCYSLVLSISLMLGFPDPFVLTILNIFSEIKKRGKRLTVTFSVRYKEKLSGSYTQEYG